MKSKTKKDSTDYDPISLDPEQNENPSDLNAEARELFEELCDDLDGVIPEKLLAKIKQVQPIKAAIMLLWQYGGRIRTSNPEVNLEKTYEIPEEVNQLNDKIGSFSFTIARTPFMALAMAASADINADEEVIQACDLDGFFPLIIRENNEVVRIGLVDTNAQELELTLEFSFGMNINMSDRQIELETAMEDGMKELKSNLNKLKKDASEKPKLFNSPEEEEAIRSWCEKHSYSVTGVFRASIDCYL